jgi:uncharacterized protein YjbI with pentapeptide repeats
MAQWKVAILAASILASPALAQSGPKSAPAFAVPSNTCLMTAGPLSAGRSKMPLAVDGATLKDASDVKSLRSKAKDGRLLVIQGGDFTGQKFGSDNFSNICFDGTKLANTRWTKTRAQGVGFINADLSGATFDRVVMDFVLFRNTVLARVDASGARMAYGQFDGGWDASIAGLRMDNAQMVGFRFVCGTTSTDGCAFDRKQISLRGANLSGGSISSFSIWDAQLDDVRLDQTEISLDQITQFSGANVAGPVLIRADNKRVALAPDAFRVAAGVLGFSKASDTECTAPDTPLTEIFCQAGRADLRAYRDDVNRMYESTVTPTRADGATINVTAPGKAHDRYLKALRRCALKEEEAAVACIQTAIGKRRALLVAQLTATRPLEADGRALYVSVQTPLVQIVSRDVRLAGLTPLLVDSSPHMLLAYRDDDERLVARGIALSSDGQRCAASFGPSGKKASKKAVIGPNFAAWSTGAEFTLGSVGKVKKKKPKKIKGQLAAPAVDVASGCKTMIRSGPLVRVPISEDDFDRLWATRKAAS